MEGSNNPHGRELLPANVIPRHYNLTLDPHLANFTFEGNVTIDLDVVEDSSSISFHACEINIHDAKVSSGGQEVSSNVEISYDESKQTSTLAFAGGIKKGSKVQLQIAFAGILNDNMVGFYRSGYTREDGSKAFMATTQMEPTCARRAFPCFDEPSLKATFDITLIADKNLTCLGNTEVAFESEAPPNSAGQPRKAVHFKTTPIMSTYLTAFVVGELNYVESNLFRIPVRTYAPVGQNIEHGRYAADLGAKTLEFFEMVFGVEFPLSKLDQIAVPDFAQGAMENWGLVTYRTVDLLLDDQNAGAFRRRRVTDIVQHELAHQWFGNLVTMDWWEGLWLKEGFATWASWYACNEFYPEWKVWSDYVSDDLQRCQGLDSLRSSHAVEVPVKRASDINQIFDAISYEKGCAVLRMISVYLGEDVFLAGVRSYLKKFAYSNSTTSDLWDCLTEISGKPVGAIMATWTKEVGFPVVSVTEGSSKNQIVVKQNRFLRTGDMKPEDDTVLYPVILSLRTKSGIDKSIILTEREMIIDVPEDGFFKLNANQSNIYRTLYTPAQLKQLGEAIQSGLVPVDDRTGIVADTAALSASGHLKTSAFLDLVYNMKSENEYVVWKEMTRRMSIISSTWVFENQHIKDGLEAFKRDLVRDKAHELGWNITAKDDHIAQQFKHLLFHHAAMCGDEKAVAAAKDMFNRCVDGDESAVHPTIRKSVFCVAMKYGGVAEFDKAWEFYLTAKTSDERVAALASLGHGQSPEMIQKALNVFLSDHVKNQDAESPLMALQGSAAGTEALFKFATENWDFVCKRFPPGLSTLSRMVKTMSTGFTKREQLAKVGAFFSAKNTKGFDKAIEQAKDTIQSNISWLERDAEDVEAWLRSAKYIA